MTQPDPRTSFTTADVPTLHKIQLVCEQFREDGVPPDWDEAQAWLYRCQLSFTATFCKRIIDELGAHALNTLENDL